MKKIVSQMLASGLSLVIFGNAFSASTEGLKLEYVRRVTERMKPHEWENQEYWSTKWSVAAVFADLNQDGCCDALVATPDERGFRCFKWLTMPKTVNGDIHLEYCASSYSTVCCSPLTIYRATLTGEISLLLGKDCFIERYECGRRAWVKRDLDVIFRIDVKGCLAPQIDPLMLDKVVANPGFVRLDRVLPSWYCGYELRLAPPDKRHSLSDGENLPNGGLSAPANFPAFVLKYREGVRRRLNLSRPIAVYAVFFDADLDGDADFYVSSDAEAVGSGRYRWSLYQNDANVFHKAKDRVWCNRGTIHDVGILEPEDVATRAAFYRVVRTFGPPQILVM